MLEWQKKYSTLAQPIAEEKPPAVMSPMKRKGKKEIMSVQRQPKPRRSEEQDRISELEKQLA